MCGQLDTRQRLHVFRRSRSALLIYAQATCSNRHHFNGCAVWILDPACTSSFQFANGPYDDGSSNRAPLLSYSYDLASTGMLIMTSSFCCRWSLLVFFVPWLLAFAGAQDNCNTQANPHCAGDARFASICCPSPNVCYFKDRLGTPGCCDAGQICSNHGQNNPQPAVATVAPNSAVSLASGLAQITASMSILTTNSLSLTTPATAFSTVGGLLVGGAQPIAQVKEATPILLPLVLMAWHTF